MPNGVNGEQEFEEGFEKLSAEEQKRRQEYDAILADQARFSQLSYNEKEEMFRAYLILNAKMNENYTPDQEEDMMAEMEEAKPYVDRAIRLLIEHVKNGMLCKQELQAEYIPELAFAKTIFQSDNDKEEMLQEFEQYRLNQLKEDDLALQQEAAKEAPENKAEEKKAEENAVPAGEDAKEEVKQEKKPRPWDNMAGKREYEIEEAYGPKVAEDGTTREEFFDRMEAQGWNKEGDEEIIAAFYVRCADNLHKGIWADAQILQKLMAQPARTLKERGKVAEMALEVLPVTSTSDNQKTMEYRLNDVVDHSRFMARMQEEQGWTREGDEKILAIMAKVPDRLLGKSGEKHLRSELLDYDGTSEYGRKDAITFFRNEAKNSLNDQDLDVLDQEVKRIDKWIARVEKESELKKNSVLRSYFNRIVELGLDQLEPLGIDGYDWAVGDRFDNVTLDDPHMLDGVNAEIDKLEIDTQKLDKGGTILKLIEELKEPFKEIVQKQFGQDLEEDAYNLDSMFYIDFSEHVSSPEDVKNYLKSSLKQVFIERKKEQLIAADMEKNPLLYQRRDKINAAVEKMSAILYELQDAENSEFLNAAKDKKDTSGIVVENRRRSRGGYYDVEKDSKAAQDEMFSILDKLATLKKENKLNSLQNLKDVKQLEDPFWDTYSRKLSDQEISALQQKITQITDAGIDWFEYIDTGAYEKFLKQNHIRIGGDFDPYKIAKQSCEGPVAVESLKNSCSIPNYEQTMKCLDLIEAEYAVKKDAIADMDVETVTGWFGANGYNMMENSILAVNGFSEKIVDGQVQRVINLGDGIALDKLDRDRLNQKEYQELVNSAKEAQALYQKNERAFQHVFNTMNRKKESTNFDGILMHVGKNIKAINNDPELLRELNHFRHLLYRIRQADVNVCKLVDVNEKTKEKTEMIVEPLDGDVEFNQQMVSRENEILKVCYNMVHEPSTRVSRNSSEYDSVMKSILNVQKVLDKQYGSNEEARAAYVKAVKKVLNNINRYRLHKANDGVKQDATHDKLIALERVDKLLRTRFQSLEQREYEDAIGAVPELFKVDVPQEKLGDQYLLEKALGKIKNMHKQIEDYRAEIDKEQSMIKRSNTIGGIVHSNLLDGKKEEKNPKAEDAEKKEPEKKEPEKKEPQKSLQEKIGFEKLDEKEVAGKRMKSAEEVQEPGRAKALSEKMLSGDVPKALKENPQMVAIDKQETDYRKSLDLQDENERARLFSSAEKSLYLEILLQGCIKKGESAGKEEAVETLEKGIKSLKKSGIKARAFMAEHLTDKDFNKEFRDRVLKGAADQKVSHADIKQYRDEALKACYTKYKGKDVHALDNLSRLLGSKVNAKSVQKQQEADKKAKTQKVAGKK